MQGQELAGDQESGKIRKEIGDIKYRKEEPKKEDLKKKEEPAEETEEEAKEEEVAREREEEEVQAGDQQGQELVDKNKQHKDKTLLSGRIAKVGSNENIENIRKEESEEEVPEEDQEEGRLNGGKEGSNHKIKIGTEPMPVPMDPLIKPEKEA